MRREPLVAAERRAAPRLQAHLDADRASLPRHRGPDPALVFGRRIAGDGMSTLPLLLLLGHAVALEECEHVGADDGAGGVVGWVQHLRDAGRVEVDDEVAVDDDVLLQNDMELAWKFPMDLTCCPGEKKEG